MNEMTITTASCHGFSCGDLITISRPALRWWQLIARWRRWREPASSFVVTKTSESVMTVKANPVRQVCLVTWGVADAMLQANEGWSLAPEEDDNQNMGVVYLQRWL